MTVAESEQAVIIQLPLSKELGSVSEVKSIHKIEDKIRQLLRRENVGELDGDEIGCGHCLIFLYGQDADKIVAVIEPVLKTWQALKGGTLTRRYGPLYSEQTVTNY